MGIPFCEHYLLMTAAPALQVTSSCELVPPEQPIPPTSLPSSMRGSPPRDAMIPSSVSTELELVSWIAFSKTLVSRRKVADARALCSAIWIEASCAPSIRWKATRLPPESATATNSTCTAPYLVACAADASRAGARGTGTRLVDRRAAQPYLLSPSRS